MPSAGVDLLGTALDDGDAAASGSGRRRSRERNREGNGRAGEEKGAGEDLGVVGILIAHHGHEARVLGGGGTPAWVPRHGASAGRTVEKKQFSRNPPGTIFINCKEVPNNFSDFN